MTNRNINTDIFREKSIKRISSPESLDKYIKSTTPSLWLLLCAIIALLIGIIVWGSFGKIDSASVVGCRVENNTVTAYIKEVEYSKLCDESYLEINGEKYNVENVSGPSLYVENSDSFLINASEIKEGTWYYTVTCHSEITDGNYKGKMVYEQISPITFIFN